MYLPQVWCWALFQVQLKNVTLPTLFYFIGGAFSQAKGAFSNWWNNFLVNPEQGQKVPETATEAQAASTETIDISSDIPKTVTTNCIDSNHKLKGDTCDVDKSEISSEDSPSPGSEHQPGEIHTV